MTAPRCVAAAALFASLVASAAEPVLARSAPNLTVDASDIRGEVLRLPQEHRQTALSEPQSVMQLANNLMIRRSMAAEAEAAGLGNDPAVQAAIRIARDRVLSDALIAKMEAGNKPPAAVVEKLAEAQYKANPARFVKPEETRARHILILKQVPDGKARAEKLLQELKAGANFEELARKESGDPGSAAKGGDLGFFPKGRMVPEFQAAVDALKIGETSGVVESQFGFHIIRVEERRPAGTYTFAEVKDSLRFEAEQQAVNEARMAKVQKIQDTIELNTIAIEEFAKSNKSVVRR